MLSIATVKSAAGAAHYFGKDDYYLGEGPGEFSEWGGQGAETLGLKGEVTRENFEKVLNSTLPDGTVVNSAENKRRTYASEHRVHGGRERRPCLVKQAK